jgi:hypothetical protein
VSEENPTGAASAAPQLICAECGAKSPPDAAGWRAHLTDDDEAAAFCPECAAREFGGQ